ncbi:PDZ domain-containing protein [Nocardioides caricicola]|uniref:PDZ domain-containing protein n=1 Tax=Nocardioides caricicola TaxID=634770 RepID=A0ABW0N2Y1_9ACTN
MTQRTVAGVLAVPLLIGLWLAAALHPLPYVTYEPGLTLDVLGTNDQGDEIIEVSGHDVYRDDGQLRMTTVYVSQPLPKGSNNLFELMYDWVSDEDAVYPYDAVYREDETVEQNREEGAAEMTSSQDAATAAALEELGYDVTHPAVVGVVADAPADGELENGDVILEVDDTEVADTAAVAEAVAAAPEGEPVDFLVLRDDQRIEVPVTPEVADGRPQVGIQLGTVVTPDLPVDVTINIDQGIGGPSAGLMFSLGIYDTLTPGSLTGGQVVAGTGTLDATGTVGPIGGIQQKIVGARDAGAQLFLVPPDNCDQAVLAPNDDMRLVRAPTMHSARESIEAWVDDHDADLPSCEKGDA